MADASDNMQQQTTHPEQAQTTEEDASGEFGRLLQKAFKPRTDKAKEIAEADHPHLRMFTVGNTAVDEPAADVRGRWVVCTPKDVANFSATAYFFGRDLQTAIKRPMAVMPRAFHKQKAADGISVQKGSYKLTYIRRFPDEISLEVRQN